MMPYAMPYSYTYHMIVMYNSSPFLLSFLIYLYNTYYMAGLVIGHKMCIIMRFMGKC